MAEEQKFTKEEMLAKAYEPQRLAEKYHPFYRGKVEVIPKCVIRDFDDFGIWYTPGVAQSCKIIHEDPLQSFLHTNRWNSIAVVSDGTRVLGLGNIGPEAAMPVMEGKALLFKYLGGVDAFPLCLNTTDEDEIINICKAIQPSIGGINLEDIQKPKCFSILDRLRADPDLHIPVWHDDQQGTATIVTAGLINAAKMVDKKLGEMKVAMIGAGAANIAIARVLVSAGVTKSNIVMVEGSHANAMKGADACLAASKPGPDTILPEWVAGMADKSIVFATANPIPEIWPWDAKEAGAYIVATGRSDFPNQVNNSLGFPGIFRGTLDVRASTITDEMVLAAAYELAQTAEDKGLRTDYIVPTMDDWEVFPREATAVGLKAIEQGIARVKKTREELFQGAEALIKRSRDMTQNLMDQGFIPPPPE